LLASIGITEEVMHSFSTPQKEILLYLFLTEQINLALTTTEVCEASGKLSNKNLLVNTT
jgi:hypothetical protein